MPSVLKVVLKTLFSTVIFLLLFDLSLLVVDRTVTESRVQKLFRDISEVAARNNGVPYEMLVVFQERIDSIEERSFMLSAGSIEHNMTQSLTLDSQYCSSGTCDSIGFYGASESSTARVYEYGEWMDVAMVVNYQWNSIFTTFIGTMANGGSTLSADGVMTLDRGDYGARLPSVKYERVNAMRLLK